MLTDKQRSWKDYSNTIVKAGSKDIVIRRKIRKYLLHKVQITLYKSFIHFALTNFNYRLVIWLLVELPFLKNIKDSGTLINGFDYDDQ